MPNYTIPPRLKPSDYTKGKLTQDEIISLQIANDANIAAARKAIMMNEPPLEPTAFESATPQELLADDAAQEATARSNIEKLGFRPQEASEIITNIRTDPTLDFTQLNTNFPAIEADIKKRFSVKLLTPTFFVEYFRKYSEELAGAAGMRVFNPNNAGLNGLINSVADLRAVIPDPALIQYIADAARRSNIGSRDMLDRLDELIRLLPTPTGLQGLSQLQSVQQQRIIDDVLSQFQNLPSTGEINDLVRVLRNDQLTRQEFYDALTALVDSIPTGSQTNIVSSSLGLAMPKSSGTTAPSTPIMSIQSFGPATPSSAASTAIPTYGAAPKITVKTLGSSLNLGTAKLFEIKETLRLHPDIADELRDNSTGTKVDVNQLSLSTPKAGSRSKKINWADTNLAELMKTKFGTGIKNRIIPKIKLKVGKGLAVKQTPSYREYGKYAIHIPQLEQQDLLNVKYKSLGQIPKFKAIPVSDIFRDFILDLLENGKPNVRVYTQISPEERKFFEEMSIGAGVWNGLGLKRTTTSTDEEENKRFELLKGEYLAGNNNPKVISELRRMVVKMMNDGRIRKTQGVDLLMELSI